MGGLIRSLTAFFLFKTQNCGSERRRVCCAGVEQSLLWQVYRHLCTISTYFPFFATGTRISGGKHLDRSHARPRATARQRLRYVLSSQFEVAEYGTIAR